MRAIFGPNYRNTQSGILTLERQGCFDPRLPLEGMVWFLRLAELNQDWRSLCEELSPEELEQVCYWNLQTVMVYLYHFHKNDIDKP